MADTIPAQQVITIEASHPRFDVYITLVVPHRSIHLKTIHLKIPSSTSQKIQLTKKSIIRFTLLYQPTECQI